MVIRNGSMQLFRIFGITVYLHWSWLLVAAWQISRRTGEYSSPAWTALEYMTLFCIVLMHEFGHALACRSVGGRADTIMLWPLGGIAFVKPPMRPGAYLWSIFAGPLVNIVLVPVTLTLWVLAHQMRPGTDLAAFAWTIAWINGILLAFNMLPIYPLDGGQILQSLLWFVLGFVKSLRIVSVIGIIGAVGLALLAFTLHLGTLTYVIIAFIGMQAYNGFRLAQYIAANPEALKERM